MLKSLPNRATARVDKRSPTLTVAPLLTLPKNLASAPEEIAEPTRIGSVIYIQSARMTEALNDRMTVIIGAVSTEVLLRREIVDSQHTSQSGDLDIEVSKHTGTRRFLTSIFDELQRIIRI